MSEVGAAVLITLLRAILVIVISPVLDHFIGFTSGTAGCVV
jgi:hypothetical protein